MTDQKREAVLGAALARLVDLALADDTLRDGLLALAALIAERSSAEETAAAVAEIMADAEHLEADLVVPPDADLVVDGLAAAQEIVVDPDVGLHVRPTLR